LNIPEFKEHYPKDEYSEVDIFNDTNRILWVYTNPAIGGIHCRI